MEETEVLAELTELHLQAGPRVQGDAFVGVDKVPFVSLAWSLLRAARNRGSALEPGVYAWIHRTPKNCS